MDKRMPVSVSLVPTRLSIRKRKSSRPKDSNTAPECFRDGEFPGKQTFREFIHDFLLEFKEHPSMVEDTFSGFRVDRIVPADLRKERNPAPLPRLHGRLSSGRFGFESDLVDIRDRTKVKKRERTDCELIPFFYLFEFMEGADCTILLTEQFGVYSPKTTLIERLQQYVDARLPDGGEVETETIVNERVVKKLLKNKIRALRFYFTKVAADIADDLGNDTFSCEDGTMELVVKPNRKRKFLFDWSQMDEWRRRGITVKDVKSEGMKVDVEIDGKTKAVDIGNLDSFRASFPVVDKAEVEENGHPSEEQMLLEANEALPLCREVLGWPSPDRRSDRRPRLEKP